MEKERDMALYTASESPAIITREVDLTAGVPNVPTSTGAMVGDFRWGPVEQPVLINNEAALANKFGNPDAARAIDFLSASNYLQYSDDLYIVRAITEYGGTGGLQPAASATVTLTNGDSGTISSIVVSANGGYISEPTVAITAPDSGSVTLTLTYDSANDEVDEVNAGGDGYYSSIPTVTFTGGRDPNASANAYVTNGKSVAPANMPVVKNQDHWDGQRVTRATDNHTAIAKWPGDLGNSLKVSMCSAKSGDFAAWAYKGYFDAAPATSNYVSDRGAANDEVHIIVIDEDGAFSGDTGKVLEVWPFVSSASDAKNDQGSSNYAVDVINRGSNYIWLAALPSSLGTNVDTAISSGKNFAAGATGTFTSSLVNGANSGTLGKDEIQVAFDNYDDPNNILVDFLIAPGMASAEDQKIVVNHLVGIAEQTRKDCVVVASPNRDAVVSNATPRASIITALDAHPFTRSSYLLVDGNYLKVYDKFNDDYKFIPAASSTAGIMSASDNNTAPWYSPAGNRRGRYFGVASLAFNPNKSDRDELYKAGVNPVVNLPGQGVVLFGDKTHLSRPSAFDRINVRRLFLVLERAIATAAQNILFEFNDEFTRAEFVNIVEPVLRNVQGRRGITDFRLVCDETNNTAEIIDTNQFVANIFIKPARSINFITLNFVAVRSGVSFEEVVGSGV